MSKQQEKNQEITATRINLLDAERETGLNRRKLMRRIQKLKIPIHQSGIYRYITSQDVEAIKQYEVQYVNLSEVARQLNLNLNAVQQYIEELHIPTHGEGPGGSTRIAASEVENIRKQRDKRESRSEMIVSSHISMGDAEKITGLKRKSLLRYLQELNISPVKSGVYRYLTPKDVEAIKQHKAQVDAALAGSPESISLTKAANSLDISVGLLRYHIEKLCITPHRRGVHAFITPKEFDAVMKSLKEARHIDTETRSTWHQPGYKSSRPNKERYSRRKRTPEELAIAKQYKKQELEPLPDWLPQSEAAFCLTVRVNQEAAQPPYRYIAPHGISQLCTIGKINPKFIKRLTRQMQVYNKQYIMHDVPLPGTRKGAPDLTPEHIAEWIREYPRMLREMQALGWHIPYLQEAQDINSRQRAIS